MGGKNDWKLGDPIDIRQLRHHLCTHFKKSRCLFREINVRYNNGKKVQKGEFNNLTEEELMNEDLLEDYKKTNYQEKRNSYSIFCKHFTIGNQKLVCVDIDTKEKTKLKEYLDSNGHMNCETNKGYHYYMIVEDLPKYKNDQKVYCDKKHDVDLINPKVNAWEPMYNSKLEKWKGRKYHSSTGKCLIVNWEEIKKYFNEKRMNIEGAVVEEQAITEDDIVVNEPTVIEITSIGKITNYLNRLSKTNNKRYNYEMFMKVGMILFNNFEGTDDGLRLYLDWQKEDPLLDTEHKHRTIEYITQKYRTFNNDVENPATFKTLRFWADEDTPENKWKAFYLKTGLDGVTDEMNKEIAFNKLTSEYIIEFDERWCPKSRMQAMNHYAHLDFNVEIEDNVVTLNPFKIWEKNMKRKQYTMIVFDPLNKNPGCYNLWDGYPMTKESVEFADVHDCQPILDHIKSKWCRDNETYYNYVLNWFASKLQKPWLKLAVVICLKSKEGAGKGIVLNLFKKIMGKYYTSIANVNTILGDFNGMIEGKMLIDLDEVCYGGNKQNNNRLKNLITEDTQVINKKNKENYEIENYADFLITTNEYWFIGVNEDSRRYFCLEMDNTLAGILDTETKKNYVDKLLACPTESLAKLLYNRDISNFRPRSFEKTKLFQKQCELNWGTSTKFIYKCLESGILNAGDNYTARIRWNNNAGNKSNGFFYHGKYYHYLDKLYEFYIKAELGDYAKKEPQIRFEEVLMDVFEGHVEKKVDARRAVMIHLPDIEIARECFSKHQAYRYKFGCDLEVISSTDDNTIQEDSDSD